MHIIGCKLAACDDPERDPCRQQNQVLQGSQLLLFGRAIDRKNSNGSSSLALEPVFIKSSSNISRCSRKTSSRAKVAMVCAWRNGIGTGELKPGWRASLH